MRKILFLLFITLLSCSTNYDDLSNLDKCPNEQSYNKHNWTILSTGSTYHIEKCVYCNRARRVHHKSNDFDYETTLSDDGLVIHVTYNDKIKGYIKRSGY
jgi:thioredoxin-related protein